MAKVATKTYYGQCKCCLKETHLKNMWYTGTGQEEVYGQMLVDCFAIDWMIQGNIEDDKICEQCISKLRVATTFKNQVLNCQAGILEGTKVEEIREDEDEVEEEMSFNLNGEEQEYEEEEEESLQEESLQEESLPNREQKTYEDVEYLEEEALEDETNDDNSLDYEPAEKKLKWPKKPPPSERNKIYMQYSQNDLTMALKAVKERKMNTVTAAKTFNIPRKTISKKLYDNTDKKDIFNMTALLRAIKGLLMYTNATPFRIKLRTYNCMFCSSNIPGFEDPDDLRSHTHSAHGDKVTQIEFALRPHHMNQMIRLDITNLVCDCGEDIKWSDMFNHLQTRHNVEDIQDAWTKIVPYNLMNFPSRENTCALCDYTACFSKVDTHMNLHFKNFVCGDCGKPYVTMQRLKSHELYHEIGEFRCDQCHQVFQNHKSRRQHIKIVHEKLLPFKCTLCPERFVSDRQKLQHLRDEHENMLPLNGRTCKFCNLSFWPKDYWRHMRRKHSRINCAVCKRTFENMSMLRKHKCKGAEVNKYQCDQCFRLFFSVEAVVTHKKSCEEKYE